jgi:penicillin-binding protein-related factor A (putative recombinase)
MLEKQIENNILAFLEEINVFAWKNQSVGIYDAKRGAYRKPGKYQLSGVADILGILNGKFLAIEVKSANGVLSENQRVFIRGINELGGIAFVSRSVTQTFEQLKPFLTDWKMFEHIAAKWSQIEDNAQGH